MADETSTGPWVVQLLHKDFPNASFDLSEFAVGASEQGNNMWAGGFSGRPGLLADLLPSLKVSVQGLTPKGAINCCRTPLRAFWRYLDARESYFLSRGIAHQKVNRLHHITGVTFDSWMQGGPDGAWQAACPTYGRSLRPIIEDALHERDLDPIHTASISDPQLTPKDTVSDEEGVALIRYLRGRSIEIFRRWQRADALAAQGRDLAAIYLQHGRQGLKSLGLISEADAHATYRAVAEQVGTPAPSASDFMASLGYAQDRRLKKVSGWPCNVRWIDLIKGQHPTSEDVCILALLCMGRLAWNPSTLFSIDIANWHGPYDDRYEWVYAPKARAGGAFQHGVSETNQRTGAYSVLNRLIARSAPLRAWVPQNPSAHSTPSIVQRSPFVGVNMSPGAPVFVVNRDGDHAVNRRLRQCIQEHNAQPGALQVRDMTVSDFRDLAAAVMFRDSRYSMWVAQLLLGHASQRSTIRYGYRNASREESHRQVVMVVGDILDQARETGQMDPTLTRARVEGIEVTTDAKARLDAFRSQRTYAGVRCETPTDPPKHIDPENPRDGRTLCAQGHACVSRGCPVATVLPDSLDPICRSVAELEWRRERLGAVRWDNSSAAADLRTLRETLQQWPPAEVKTHLDRWRKLLTTGEHRPLILGGAHV